MTIPLLLAACQSAPGGSAPEDDLTLEERVATLRTSNDGLERDVIELRAQIAALAEQAAPALAVGVEANDSRTARIAALDARLARIGASLVQAGAPAPGDVADAIGRARPAAVEPLKERLRVLERQHALHCENVANAATPGYRRRTLTLGSAMDDASRLRVPRIEGVALDVTQAVLDRTGHELHIGIDGPGFFAIRLPDGALRYTRDGRFRADARGRLVPRGGLAFDDDVRIPRGRTSVTIEPDGHVFAVDVDGARVQIGSVRVHTFANAAALEVSAGGLLAPTVESGPAATHQPGHGGCGTLRARYVERSNVDLTAELVELQLVQRELEVVRHLLASHGVYVGG